VRVEELLARLKGVKERKPGQWTARCPAHNDTNPSLSIALADDGEILLKCFAGCSLEEICSKLGIEPKDSFPNPNWSRKRPSTFPRLPLRR
jgi:hypothetical protein